MPLHAIYLRCEKRCFEGVHLHRAPQKRESMSASLIGRFGSSAFKLSTTSVVGVAHGLALLFGIGPEALPLWDPRMRRTNLRGGLTEAEPSGHTISPHPSSREGHHPTMWWSLCSFLSRLVAYYHAATACCRIQQNSVPSIQMRCMITANWRASATIAFFSHGVWRSALPNSSAKTILLRGSAVSGLPRRASSASSRRRILIYRRCSRSPRIDACKV